jgi:hypothetical protein
MNGIEPILSVIFFRGASGNEPVREWLKSLPREERRILGEDIKTVQFGWPLGMPLVRKLDKACGKFAPGFLIASHVSYSPRARVA